MNEEKPKRKRKKKAAAEGEGSKEHKKSWREVNATPEEIKAFLNDHIYLRYNLVKYRIEARLPSEDPFWQNNELAQFVSDDWQPMSDRLKNTLLNALRSLKPTGKGDFMDVLYRQGYRHYFTKAEEAVLKEHNRAFEMPSLEQESICRYFRPPKDDEKGEFYTATDILGHIGGNPALRMTIEKIGSAMKALGYRQYRSHGRRGYRVVPYKPDEIEMNRRMLANDARLDNSIDDQEGDGGDS